MSNKNMIVRVWHGRTPTVKADEYEEYLEATGFKDYDTATGNRGVLAFRRDNKESDTSDFLLVSFWETIGSISEFAGKDIEKAVYYPRDKEFLIELEPNVSHYELIHSTGHTATFKSGLDTRKKSKSRRK